MAKNYWLVKSEPEVYSITDLESEGVTEWWGVRNYRARNLMRDEMKVGDPVLFYHSNCDLLGVYGVAEVASAAHPDSKQFEVGHREHGRRAVRHVAAETRHAAVGSARHAEGVRDDPRIRRRLAGRQPARALFADPTLDIFE